MSVLRKVIITVSNLSQKAQSIFSYYHIILYHSMRIPIQLDVQGNTAGSVAMITVSFNSFQYAD